MNSDEVWNAIDSQRGRTADLLSTLTDEQWNSPSLCDGWTVRDVAAHLTLQQLRLVSGLKMALPIVFTTGALGTNRIIHLSAVRAASKPTDQLIAEIRGMIGQRVTNISIRPASALIDTTVHAQDIAIPLGISMPVSTAVTSFCADTHLTSSRRLRSTMRDIGVGGLSLRATDADWRHGTGPEVHGTMLALLLLVTGRTARLDDLDGPGVALVGGDHAAD